MEGKAIILDMDGVLLQTHHLHALAWKETFDAFFEDLASTKGFGKIKEFDLVKDYRKFLNGRPRTEGIKSYLEALGISLPHGSDTEGASFESLEALGKLKQRHYQSLLAERGPKVYPDSLEALKRWTHDHVPMALVSSSEFCKAVLQMGKIEIYFDTIVDPELAKINDLNGKPAPDYFIHAAELLGYAPEECVVVEDSEVGVRAAKKGGFLKVYGLVRDDERFADERRENLMQAGADALIQSLHEIKDLGESWPKDLGAS